MSGRSRSRTPPREPEPEPEPDGDGSEPEPDGDGSCSEDDLETMLEQLVRSRQIITFGCTLTTFIYVTNVVDVFQQLVVVCPGATPPGLMLHPPRQSVNLL